MTLRSLACALVIAITMLGPTRVSAQAQDGWLSDPLIPWNQTGMTIPPAPLDHGFIDQLCTRSIRPPETIEDLALADLGWVLFGPYEGGWGFRVMGATAGFDGMCRPVGYQHFVFWNGAFAGTLSPVPMASRATGAGRILSIDSERRLVANFIRYAAEDPLCCPSRPALAIEFRIVETDDGPILVPERTFEFN